MNLTYLLINIIENIETPQRYMHFRYKIQNSLFSKWCVSYVSQYIKILPSCPLGKHNACPRTLGPKEVYLLLVHRDKAYTYDYWLTTQA